MYRGFNIEDLNIGAIRWKDIYSTGKSFYSQQHENQITRDKKKVKLDLETLFNEDTIDAQ